MPSHTFKEYRSEFERLLKEMEKKVVSIKKPVGYVESLEEGSDSGNAVNSNRN